MSPGGVFRTDADAPAAIVDGSDNDDAVIFDVSLIPSAEGRRRCICGSSRGDSATGSFCWPML
jgi:hypothetical protein